MNKGFLRFFWVLLITFILVGNSYAAYPPPVAAKNGMVVTEHYLASQVGADILRQGGNAIDAAVAVGYALAVVYPCCGNIGGGGFMTIRLANGKDIFLNFREKAPLAAQPNMYLDSKGNFIIDKSTYGYLAVATPGTVMGLDTALQKYGTMKREQVMAPAIRLAENGFVLTEDDIKKLYTNIDEFKQQPNVVAIFLKNNQPYVAGDRLVQKNLANTLKQIAKGGSDVFYKGPIAEAIVKASQTNKGLLSLKDFSDYTVQELQPIYCTYHDYKIISSPPPSSGGVALCEMLNILEAYPLVDLGFHSSQSIHYITEAMRYTFADRNNKLGDPDFVKMPIQELISKEYATQIRRRIATFKATPSAAINVAPQQQKAETTHYSITDKFGNAVSVTYTLNGNFGSSVIAGNTGFFLNDEMDDFSAKIAGANQYGLEQGAKNSIAPGKRPLSSMAPTIITKDNKLFMLLGSPGGPRIITSVLQSILNVVDYKMDIKQAVDEPRFHQQWMPDVIFYEPFAINKDAMQNLTTMGYQFKQEEPWSGVEAILYNPTTNIYYGASDDRKPLGRAIGY